MILYRCFVDFGFSLNRSLSLETVGSLFSKPTELQVKKCNFNVGALGKVTIGSSQKKNPGG